MPASVSTDKNLHIIETLKEPEPIFPRFGTDYKSELKELLESFPDFVPGKKQRLSAADRDKYQGVMARAAYWDGQKKLVQNYIRFLLGDAEYGYTGKLIWVQRRKSTKAGYSVAPTDVDAIYPI